VLINIRFNRVHSVVHVVIFTVPSYKMSSMQSRKVHVQPPKHISCMSTTSPALKPQQTSSMFSTLPAERRERRSVIVCPTAEKNLVPPEPSWRIWKGLCVLLLTVLDILQLSSSSIPVFQWTATGSWYAYGLIASQFILTPQPSSSILF